MSLEVQRHLADRMNVLAESATLRMARLARELAAQGREVINLSIGEPDFDTPDFIKEAAKKALDEGYTKYTPVNGIPELRKAVCTKFKRDNNLEFTEDQIVVSNGAKQSLANIFLALLNPGDEVIIPAPFWVSYTEIVKLAEGQPVIVPAPIEQDYKVTADQVARAITNRTKAILFSSPCNPTGSVFSKAELEAIAEVLAPHDHIFIVSDEIYEYINFGERHESIGTIASVKDRTVTVNGFSKGFAMTGWRLGYIGAPAWLANACTKVQGQVTSGANSFSQKAAVDALLKDRSETEAMRDAFLRRRDLVIDLLSDIPGMKVNKPLGAFYIFPDISAFFGRSNGAVTINDANDFCEFLLTEAHVAVVAGSAFGADNCFRLSYAASETELRTAIARIKNALKGFGL